MLKTVLTSLSISVMLYTSAQATCRPVDSFVTRLNEVPLIMNDPEAGWPDLYIYEAGTTCFVHQLGRIDEIGSEKTAILVAYTPSHKTSLRECPTGTEYLMTRTEWDNDCAADRNLNYQQEIRKQIKNK